MDNLNCDGLLIRSPHGARAASIHTSLGFSASVEIEPLFQTTLAGDGARGLTPREASWHRAHLPKLTSQDAWEAAHERASALADALGAAGDITFVEPDIEHHWPVRAYKTGANGQGFAAAGACTFEDQNRKLPRVPGQFAWHLDPAFSQLAQARQEARNGAAAPIRIAHLDTGYDPDHDTFPGERLRRDLQRNFADVDRPNDARDPGEDGVLKFPGHGTGTLGILAGGHVRVLQNGYHFDDVLGGAPDAEIVAVRVGNSVVQFKTSHVAQGIAYATSLCASADTAAHVLSMSMGGVASEAWADAVNDAYSQGIVLVTAAGNNYAAIGGVGLPTRFIVYPARFRRVIAACGVMANFKPYDRLDAGTMQGNWGPDSKMRTAMAAYTPNTPWAVWGCSGLVDMDGAGTSSATPQIAAAAALYLQRHADVLFDRGRYPQAWMRVEAVRHALFASAQPVPRSDAVKIGRGLLRASTALAVAPRPAAELSMTPEDSAGFAFWRVLTGLGIAAPSPAERMFALEAAQLAQRWPFADRENPFDSLIADPDLELKDIPQADVRSFLEQLLAHPLASDALRRRVRDALDDTAGPGGGHRPEPDELQDPPQPADLARERKPPAFVPPRPPRRRLRCFAIDPLLSTNLDTATISRVTLSVPWEDLEPGPMGEYLDVVDIDPASGDGCCYEPVNLDDPALLAQDGLPASEGTPQFHQQMVYAVCSLTIDNFEKALGRRILWRHQRHPKFEADDSRYVQRLRVYPHALREANAYYSPEKVALLFGYFNARNRDPGDQMPGGRVFTCLSHDIIAHETTHALLDGMHRQFLLPTNPDVHAFHEGFSDIVALFQRLTFPEMLRHQIAATRGDIRNRASFLGSLALQFGPAHDPRTRGALREGIGRLDENNNWVPHKPNPAEYQETLEPHARGAILVGAVFDAYLSIYERRTADLFRLATGGTGVLPAGAIHPDLVERLAREAAKSARHVLRMCIRALDYTPPTDISFGEYLRAIITADHDLVTSDDLDYRIAFVEAFRRRGIHPRNVAVLSVESLLWGSPHDDIRPPSDALLAGLVGLNRRLDEYDGGECRKTLFEQHRRLRIDIHDWLATHFKGAAGNGDAAFLGIDPNRSFEVHAARIAHRASPDGIIEPQLILSILQSKWVETSGGGRMPFVGGATIITDLRHGRVKYCIRKSALHDVREKEQQAFMLSRAETLRSIYAGDAFDETDEEPFALLHRGV